MHYALSAMHTNDTVCMIPQQDVVTSLMLPWDHNFIKPVNMKHTNWWWNGIVRHKNFGPCYDPTACTSENTLKIELYLVTQINKNRSKIRKIRDLFKKNDWVRTFLQTFVCLSRNFRPPEFIFGKKLVPCGELGGGGPSIKVVANRYFWLLSWSRRLCN